VLTLFGSVPLRYFSFVFPVHSPTTHIPAPKQSYLGDILDLGCPFICLSIYWSVDAVVSVFLGVILFS
jgi:hypothetical protein